MKWFIVLMMLALTGTGCLTCPDDLNVASSEGHEIASCSNSDMDFVLYSKGSIFNQYHGGSGWEWMASVKFLMDAYNMAPVDMHTHTPGYELTVVFNSGDAWSVYFAYGGCNDWTKTQ
jgi:hypothetical protein